MVPRCSAWNQSQTTTQLWFIVSTKCLNTFLKGMGNTFFNYKDSSNKHQLAQGLLNEMDRTLSALAKFESSN